MLDALSDRRATALRLLLGSFVDVAVSSALMACSDRNQQPASAFTKSGGQLLVRAKNILWSPAPASLPAGAKAALLQGEACVWDTLFWRRRAEEGDIIVLACIEKNGQLKHPPSA